MTKTRYRYINICCCVLVLILFTSQVGKIRETNTSLYIGCAHSILSRKQIMKEHNQKGVCELLLLWASIDNIYDIDGKQYGTITLHYMYLIVHHTQNNVPFVGEQYYSCNCRKNYIKPLQSYFSITIIPKCLLFLVDDGSN